MKNIITKFIIFSIAFGLNNSTAYARDLDVEIKPQRQNYSIDGLIDLQLTIVNNNEYSISMLLEYPDRLGLRFTSQDGVSVKKDEARFDEDKIIPYRELGPGEKYITNIALNRYLQFPNPGDMEVNYQIIFNYAKTGQENKGRLRTYKTKGEFTLKIDGNRKRDVATQYWLMILNQEEVSDQQFQEAIELLSFSKESTVVPALLSAIDRASNNDKGKIAETISKQAENEKVQEHLIQMVAYGDSMQAAEIAIQTLANHHIAIPDEAITDGLLSENVYEKS